MRCPHFAGSSLVCQFGVHTIQRAVNVITKSGVKLNGVATNRFFSHRRQRLFPGDDDGKFFAIAFVAVRGPFAASLVPDTEITRKLVGRKHQAFTIKFQIRKVFHQNIVLHFLRVTLVLCKQMACDRCIGKISQSLFLLQYYSYFGTSLIIRLLGNVQIQHGNAQITP